MCGRERGRRRSADGRGWRETDKSPQSRSALGSLLSYVWVLAGDSCGLLLWRPEDHSPGPHSVLTLLQKQGHFKCVQAGGHDWGGCSCLVGGKEVAHV